MFPRLARELFPCEVRFGWWFPRSAVFLAKIKEKKRSKKRKEDSVCYTTWKVRILFISEKVWRKIRPTLPGLVTLDQKKKLKEIREKKEREGRIVATFGN